MVCKQTKLVLTTVIFGTSITSIVSLVNSLCTVNSQSVMGSYSICLVHLLILVHLVLFIYCTYDYFQWPLFSPHIYFLLKIYCVELDRALGKDSFIKIGFKSLLHTCNILCLFKLLSSFIGLLSIMILLAHGPHLNHYNQ